MTTPLSPAALLYNLEGAVEMLTARLDLVEAELAERPAVLRGPVASIVADAARLFEIPAIDILSERKMQGIAEARHAVAWVAKRATSFSLPRIAGALRRKHHTTIMNSIRRADELRALDPVFLDRTDQLLAAAEKRKPE